MHHVLIVLSWILGLSAATIAGLVVMAAVMATVRAFLGRKTTPWVVGDVPEAERRAAAEGYPHRALVALDIFMNVVVLVGQQDETMSTHAWRAATAGKLWGKLMNGWLNWIQPNHGYLAASGDLERAMARVATLSKALNISGTVSIPITHERTKT